MLFDAETDPHNASSTRAQHSCFNSFIQPVLCGMEPIRHWHGITNPGPGRISATSSAQRSRISARAQRFRIGSILVGIGSILTFFAFAHRHHRQTGISRKPGFPRVSPRMPALEGLDYNKKACLRLVFIGRVRKQKGLRVKG
jgi:hypothetical protein